MPIPVVTCSPDIVVGYSGSTQIANLAATASNSATSFSWTLLSVPIGSTALSTTRGDFINGVATTLGGSSAVQFVTDGGIPGSYVFECVATNSSGDSDSQQDKGNGQQVVVVRTQSLALVLPNNYQYDWADYVNNDFLDLESNILSGKLKITSSDTTLDRLNNKISVTGGITKTTLNPSGNEQLQISITYGSSLNTACQGNDSRLSDTRTPIAHNTSHQSGGSDSIKLDDLATPDDNTDLDATTSRHGLLRKLDNNTSNFLRGDGSWAIPPTGSGGEANTASNVGTGADVFKQKTGVDLEIRGVSGISGITAVVNVDNIDVAPTYGAIASTICQGNDSRLSDSRTPTSHAASHQNGGGDEISVAGLSGLLADDQNALAIRTTTGPTLLTVGAVANGQVLTRSGTTIVGSTPSSTDADAIHDNVAGEINALTLVTAVSGDFVLIEDASDSFNKKKVNASDFIGGGTDVDAIHDNVAGEIAALTLVTAAAGDHVLIEDASDSNNKKRVAASDFIGGGAAPFSRPATPHAQDDEFDGTTLSANWTNVYAISGSAVDPYAVFTTGDTRHQVQRSHLIVQPPMDNSTYKNLSKTFTFPTNLFMMVSMRYAHRGAGIVADEGGFYFTVGASSGGTFDGSNQLRLFCGGDAGNVLRNYTYLKNDGGSFTTVATGSTLTTNAHSPVRYFAFHKIGSTYKAWVFQDNGAAIFVGSTTTTFTADRVGFRFFANTHGQTDIGNTIMALDWIRFEETATLPSIWF